MITLKHFVGADWVQVFFLGCAPRQIYNSEEVV